MNGPKPQIKRLKGSIRFNLSSVGVSSSGCRPVLNAAVTAFRCASLGLVCNNITRLALDRCAPRSIWLLCAETERKKPCTPPPPPSFHTLLMGPELSCVTPGWALLDSWSRVRGVTTFAAKCFLFLLRGPSEARGDHKRSRWATSGLRRRCPNKKHTSAER